MKLGNIDRRAAADPDGIALVDDERELTWRGLAAEIQATIALFTTLAAQPGQRIGVLGENRVETMICHAAGILSGIGTVALSRQLTGPELCDQLTDAGAVAVVTGPSSHPAVQVAADRTQVAVIAHGTAGHPSTWRSWTAAMAAPEPPPVRTWPPTALRARRSSTPPARPAVRAAPRSDGCRGGFATAADYAEALAAKQSFPTGPHLVVGPLQHNGPLTSLAAPRVRPASHRARTVRRRARPGPGPKARSHLDRDGPHPFPPPARPARGGSCPLRRLVAGHCRAHRLGMPLRCQAGHDRLVGSGAHRVLRRQRDRHRLSDQLHGVARAPRLGGAVPSSVRGRRRR